MGPWGRKEEELAYSNYGDCDCTGGETCESCCFGCLDGFLMPDWDADFTSIKTAAKVAAQLPHVAACFNALRLEEPLPLPVTEAAMARLLDIAILLADESLAEICSKRCRLLPLRRWRLQDLVKFSTRPQRSNFWIRRPSLLRAALVAGLDLQHLQDGFFQMPLRQMILLFGSQAACPEIVKLLPKPSKAWHPPLGCDWGRRCFSEDPTSTAGLLNVGHLQAARREGLDLTAFTWYATKSCGCSPERVEWPILDLAVLAGNVKAATEICLSVTAEARSKLSFTDELRPWLEEVGATIRCKQCSMDIRMPLAFLPPSSDQLLSEESQDEEIQDVVLYPSPSSERRAAAVAVGRAALDASLRLESTKGVALYQAALALCRGDFDPSAVVDRILAYAAERPPILDSLDELGVKSWELPAEEIVRDAVREEPQPASPQAREMANTAASSGSTTGHELPVDSR